MEALVKHATDIQYLDIWNRQNLSSELDMKRRHILEINQVSSCLWIGYLFIIIVFLGFDSFDNVSS